MDDRITNEYILSAMNDLIEAVGIKESVAGSDLEALVSSGQVQQCVEAVCAQLGISPRVSVKHVSSLAAHSSGDSFHSTQLSKTDTRGRGYEGITAQVRLPRQVPLYGSAASEGLAVEVLVGDDVARHARTFLAMMAHELSHVLLYLLWHPQRDNEVWTDLTALLQGFASVLRDGRKVSEERLVAGRRKRVETTFGYLTDAQFEFAFAQVQTTLADRQTTRQQALALASNVASACSRGRGMIDEFRTLLARLHEHPLSKYRTKDAPILVRCHATGYPEDFERCLEAAAELANRVSTECRPVAWYTKASTQLVSHYMANLQATSSDLGRQLGRIADETRTLRRYAGLIFRLKQWLRSDQ